MKLLKKPLFVVLLFLTLSAYTQTGLKSINIENDILVKSILPHSLEFTESEKGEQRDAGLQLQEDINAAADNMESSFIATKRHYRFNNSVGTPIVIRNSKHEMAIDFAGSTIWLEDVKISGGDIELLKISGCENLTIKNLFVDWDPLPFVQGEIVSVNDGSYKITVKLDDSFIDSETDSILTVKAFLDHTNPSQDRRPWIHSFLFDKDTKRFKDNQGRNRVEPFFDNAVEGSAPGTFELTCKFDPIVGKNKRKTWEENINMDLGDLIVLQLRGSRPIIETGGSKNVHFENITLYASGEIGFSEGNGEGPNYYTNCKITKRPGTTRLLSIGADGINSFNQVHGPIITNSLFEYNGDDAIHIHGSLYKVLHKVSNTEYLVKRGKRIKDGETIDFYNWKNDTTYAGQSTIQSHTRNILILLPGDTDSTRVDKITLTEGISIDSAAISEDQVQYSLDYYSGRGAKVENCVFKDTYGKGVLVLAPDMIIKNNYFQHVGLYAVQICDEHVKQWNIGACPYNIQITDNEWCNNGFWTKIPDGENSKIFFFGEQKASKVNREPIDIHYSNNLDVCRSPYVLAVTTTNGEVIKTPNKLEYDEGETVTLTATPNSGYRFDNWSGDASDTLASFDVTMNSNKTVAANFSIDANSSNIYSETLPKVISIYPNPSSGLFNVSFASTYIGEINIQIFSFNGKIIRSQFLQKQDNRFTHEINIENQVPGSYLIKVVAGNEEMLQRIVKN